MSEKIKTNKSSLLS